MEISKHPEMGTIVTSIRKIAEEFPCEECKALKDDLNASKSRMTHWKDKYDELKSILSEFVNEFNNTDPVNIIASYQEFFTKVSKTIDEV